MLAGMPSRLGSGLAGLSLIHAVAAGLLPAAILVPQQAAAQTPQFGACSVTPPAGSTGLYQNGVGPEIDLTLDIDCTALAPFSPAEDDVSICVSVDGGGSRQVGRVPDTGDAIAYILSAVVDGAVSAVDPVVDAGPVPVPEGATQIERSVALRAHQFADQPQVPAGDYFDTIAGTVFVAEFGGCEDPAGSATRLSPDQPFTIPLQIVYTPVCSIISTDSVDFGVLQGVGSLAATARAQGGVSINCASGTPYTIYLGDGENAGGGQRQMANGVERLPYRLCRNASCGTLWETGTIVGPVEGAGGLTKAGTGASDLETIFAEIAEGTPLPPPGDYTDRVVVTVVY